MILFGVAEVPEFAEKVAANEVYFLTIIGGGVLIEGLVEEMEGAAEGGSAPGRVFFGFGHSWFFSCRFMNVFGIRRGFYQKNEEILSTPLPLNGQLKRNRRPHA